MEMKKINKGKSFSRSTVIVGYLLVLLALYLLYSSLWGSISKKIELSYEFFYVFIPLFILFGLFISLSTDWITIDLKKRSIYVYSRVLGIKIGNNKKLSTYGFTSILSRSLNARIGGFNLGGVSYIPEANIKELKHDVFLLTSNHRNKLLLNRFDTFEEAKEFGDMIADYIQKPLVKYNPKRMNKRKSQSP